MLRSGGLIRNGLLDYGDTPGETQRASDGSDVFGERKRARGDDFELGRLATNLGER